LTASEKGYKEQGLVPADTVSSLQRFRGLSLIQIKSEWKTVSHIIERPLGNGCRVFLARSQPGRDRPNIGMSMIAIEGLSKCIFHVLPSFTFELSGLSPST
jgi:hypothetical protein